MCGEYEETNNAFMCHTCFSLVKLHEQFGLILSNPNQRGCDKNDG